MIHTDIAVVGGGILGCLIAGELTARAPELSILVLERDAVGSGASRRSAGLHFPRGSTERVRRMSAYSERFYTGLLAAEPGLPIRTTPMSVLSAEPERVAEAYLASARMRRTDRVPAPLTGLPDGVAVWHGEGCHYADVGALAVRLAATLRGRVGVREGVAVTGLTETGDRYRLDLGTGDAVTADAVVLAPGPWLSAPAWRAYVDPLGARVKKVVALHVERRPAPGDGVVVFHDEDAFLLPLHDRGHWLFSYTCQEWDVDPDALGTGLDPAHLDEARAVLRRWSPEYAEHAVAGRVFCDAYSPGREPLAYALQDRLVFAGAANGSGYRLAPALAAETADLLVPATADAAGAVTAAAAVVGTAVPEAAVPVTAGAPPPATSDLGGPA